MFFEVSVKLWVLFRVSAIQFELRLWVPVFSAHGFGFLVSTWDASDLSKNIRTFFTYINIILRYYLVVSLYFSICNTPERNNFVPAIIFVLSFLQINQIKLNSD